jgi:hypothetical protein
VCVAVAVHVLPGQEQRMRGHDLSTLRIALFFFELGYGGRDQRKLVCEDMFCHLLYHYYYRLFYPIIAY